MLYSRGRPTSVILLLLMVVAELAPRAEPPSSAWPASSVPPRWSRARIGVAGRHRNSGGWMTGGQDRRWGRGPGPETGTRASTAFELDRVWSLRAARSTGVYETESQLVYRWPLTQPVLSSDTYHQRRERIWRGREERVVVGTHVCHQGLQTSCRS